MATFAIESFEISQKEGKTTLAAEMSSLSHTQAIMQGGHVFHRIWPDSCDEGINVIGLHHEVTYVVDHCQKDPENDVMFWHLVPTRESVKRVPNALNTEVVVYND